MRRSVLLLFAIVLQACAGLRPVAPPAPLPASVVEARLTAQYRDWRHTPYRVGGQSRAGVDCSGFVQLTFREQFASRVPRTTEQLAATGDRVRGSDRRPGDLVFFRTGVFTRHVGIYLGEGRFLHASKSRGVIISEMDSPYWRDTYWQSRRVW